jgi:hypothetical protein
MKPRQVLGLVLLAAGIVLSAWGFFAGDGPSSSVDAVMAGLSSERMSWFLMLGAAASVAGVMIFEGRRARVA